MISECKYRIVVNKPGYHPGGTAFRVETFTPSDRCQLKPKKDNAGRTHNVFRWVCSGGDAGTVARRCDGDCPLKVEADVGGFNMAHTAPCPLCRRINRMFQAGECVCKECGTRFEMVILITKP